MIDESMDTEQMALPPQPWEFRSKPAWQRLIIMLGGVFVNFILGIFIYIMLMYAYGEKFLPNENVKDGVWVKDSLGINLGIQTGDKVLTIDGERIKKFNELSTLIGFINGTNFQIERNGAVIDKVIPENFISQLIDSDKNAGPVITVRYPFVIAKVQKDSLNANADIQPKDIITAINGTPISYYDQAKNEMAKYKGQNISITLKREKEVKEIPVKVSNFGNIGVAFGRTSYNDLAKLGYYDLADIEYSFAEAIPAGWNKSWKVLTDYVKQLKKIFNPSTGAYKGLGGFISIGSVFPSEWSAQSFWNITAFLSIMLGFMNLLPIPALDGGHVVFTLWEMITGKKPGDKFLEYAQVTGFLLLIALLLFANGNDLFKLLS
jgi:regulator of sigma E protease